ncbi:MAG: hypothetical protein WAL83_10700 [Arenicellales bacterium]
MTLTHAGGGGFGDVVRSEWIKLSSLRSSRWALVIFPITSIIFGIVIGQQSSAEWINPTAETIATWDPTNYALAGLIPGYLVLPVMGLMMMTSEFVYGEIKVTLTAVPRRAVVLAAKAVVVAASAFALSVTTAFATFFPAQMAMNSAAPHATLGQPGVLRALVLSGAFLALLALIGLATGTVIRHTGGAVAVYFAFVLVVPDLLLALPGQIWRFGAVAILGNSVSATNLQPEFLSPWGGFAVGAGYAAAAMLLALSLLRRRDA